MCKLPKVFLKGLMLTRNAAQVHRLSLWTVDRPLPWSPSASHWVREGHPCSQELVGLLERQGRSARGTVVIRSVLNACLTWE